MRTKIFGGLFEPSRVFFLLAIVFGILTFYFSCGNRHNNRAATNVGLGAKTNIISKSTPKTIFTFNIELVNTGKKETIIISIPLNDPKNPSFGYIHKFPEMARNVEEKGLIKSREDK